MRLNVDIAHTKRQLILEVDLKEQRLAALYCTIYPHVTGLLLFQIFVNILAFSSL